MNDFKLHIIVVPDDDYAFIETFYTPEEAQEFLRQLVGKRVQAIPVSGELWGISNGKNEKYLLSPDGDKYPLFTREAEAVITKNITYSLSDNYCDKQQVDTSRRAALQDLEIIKDM